ncbi:MAG: DUF1653 domain-containing protein [Cellulosilyticaceae bacterium]
MKIEELKEAKRPEVGDIYRHFKGGVYRVIAIARREADRNILDVVYESMETGEVWSRELSLFMSARDVEKYPQYEQCERMLYVGRYI